MRSVSVKRLLEFVVDLRIESSVWDPTGDSAKASIGSGLGEDGGKRSRFISFRRNVALEEVGRSEDWMMCDVGG